MTAPEKRLDTILSVRYDLDMKQSSGARKGNEMATAQYTTGETVAVGDTIRFDHFGSKGRAGLVVKLTGGAVHVEWQSPSSGKTRVVKLSTKAYAEGLGATLCADGTLRTADGYSVTPGACEWTSKNPRPEAK